MTNQKQSMATYAKSSVLTPPGKVYFPAVARMVTKPWGDTLYECTLRWASDDELKAKPALYEKLMSSAAQVGAEHFRMTEDEVLQGFDSGDITSPITEGSYKDVPYYQLQAIRRKAKEGKKQIVPTLKKFDAVAKQLVDLPVAEADEIVYPGCIAALRVVLYATVAPGSKQKMVRPQLSGFVHVGVGERMQARPAEEVDAEDAQDLEGFGSAADVADLS